MKNDSLDPVTIELFKPFGVMIHELFLSYFFLRSFLLFLSASKIKFLTLRDKTIYSCHNPSHDVSADTGHGHVSPGAWTRVGGVACGHVARGGRDSL